MGNHSPTTGDARPFIVAVGEGEAARQLTVSDPEIAELGRFYYAEGYHQQYLSPGKNPNGYCGIAGTGVSCPVGLDPQHG
nr:peptide-methionine (S)-S-oxide reductase [Actinopolyspora mortivallis]